MKTIRITYSTGLTVEYTLPISQTPAEIQEQLEKEIASGVVDQPTGTTFVWQEV